MLFKFVSMRKNEISSNSSVTSILLLFNKYSNHDSKLKFPLSSSKSSIFSELFTFIFDSALSKVKLSIELNFKF